MIATVCFGIKYTFQRKTLTTIDGSQDRTYLGGQGSNLQDSPVNLKWSHLYKMKL
jgi:hypothetical protein